MDWVTPGREPLGAKIPQRQPNVKTPNTDIHFAHLRCPKYSLLDNSTAFSSEDGMENIPLVKFSQSRVCDSFFPGVLRAAKLRAKQMAYSRKCYHQS